MSLSRRIHERTPAHRDRYLDFLRVASIFLVVIGHWVVRAVTREDGELAPGYILALQPWTQWLTLIVQVLPIFFLVGGALNAESLRRARARGTRPTDWLRKRARRLLLPLAPLLALWIAAAGVLDALSLARVTIFDPETAIIPVWFLAAYLVVTALTPATLWLHERAGGGLLIALGTAAAIGVDLLRFTVFADGPLVGGQPAVGGVNFLIVIVVIHQLGYLWADRRLPRRPAAQLLTAIAAGIALALMLASPLYPLTMVPIAGTDLPNNLAPPTAALIALGLVQLGLVLLARPALERWLARPRPWATVAIPGSQLMTIFLWHQTALLIVTALTYSTGIWPAHAEPGWRWWAEQPLWILACALVLALLATAFGRFESVSAPSDTRLSPLAAGLVHALGVLLACAGIGLLIGLGLRDPGAPLGLPLAAIVTLAIGYVLLGVFELPLGRGRPRRRTPP